MDKELFNFANDVYDVLASNDWNCTSQEFMDKYADEQELEIIMQPTLILIGKFKIEISRKD